MTNLSAGLGALTGAALLFAASAALSAEAAPSDAPMATASGPARSVAEQIDQYLRSSPAAALPPENAPGVIAGDEEERQVHGEFGVAIGTGGYRSAYVRSDIPVGKTGTVSIAVSETKGRGYGGYGYGYGGYGGYDGLGYGGYGGYGDRRSVGIGLNMTSPGAAIGPDSREFARGCGRPPVERQIDMINQLPVETGQGRCIDRWSSDSFGR
jgi:hypothetical protein